MKSESIFPDADFVPREFLERLFFISVYRLLEMLSIYICFGSKIKWCDQSLADIALLQYLRKQIAHSSKVYLSNFRLELNMDIIFQIELLN